MTAMAYGRIIRTTVATQSRTRISDEQAIKQTLMLTEERDVTKRATLRDIAASASGRQADPPVANTFRKGDPRFAGP